MLADGMIKRIKDASRNIFLALNDSGMLKKKYAEPHVFVSVNGKKMKIRDVTVNECNIYLETEEEK
jgi:hypothetical protein